MLNQLTFALCIGLPLMIYQGQGLSQFIRHERTRYVSGRNQIYDSGHFPENKTNGNFAPFVHFWERPLQKLESSLKVHNQAPSRPLFSWDTPEKRRTTEAATEKVSSTIKTSINSKSTATSFSATQNDDTDSYFQNHMTGNPIIKLSHSPLTTPQKRKNRIVLRSQKSIKQRKRNEYPKYENDTTTMKMKKNDKKSRKGKFGKKKILLKNTFNISGTQGNVAIQKSLETKPESVLLPDGDELRKSAAEGKSLCDMEDKCEHKCEERNGTAVCWCYKGFAAKGTKCTDINECEVNNGNCNGKCINTIGSRICLCSPGYRNMEGTCVDVNECLLRNGHGPCQDRCTNTVGSYHCSCEGLPATKLSSDKHTCEKVNECDAAAEGCSHSCIGASGRIFCTCPDGLELGEDWKTCQDIDECSDPTDYNVKCEFGCINTMGSYICASKS